jgi:hypothetical protein
MNKYEYQVGGSLKMDAPSTDERKLGYHLHGRADFEWRMAPCLD